MSKPCRRMNAFKRLVIQYGKSLKYVQSVEFEDMRREKTVDEDDRAKTRHVEVGDLTTGWVADVQPLLYIYYLLFLPPPVLNGLARLTFNGRPSHTRYYRPRIR